VTIQVNNGLQAASPQPVPGFESTTYAYVDGRLMWLGAGEGVGAAVDHPRNARKPWWPEPRQFDAQQLQRAANTCLKQIVDAQNAGIAPKGLLLWLTGQPLPFPLNHASTRFDAVRHALQNHDLAAFEAAALRVLGLGVGLTPSGDDFIGGVFFALAHAPQTQWQGSVLADFSALKNRIRVAAKTSTNAISAALLGDLMDGQSYRALHELLAALQNNNATEIIASKRLLTSVGATSGSDILAGLLLVLTTLN
jgi:hypothetical protein